MASPQSGGRVDSFGGSDTSSSYSQSGGTAQLGENYTSSSSFLQEHYVLVSHAVMATVAWAFLFPIGSIFLRLNIDHPIMLKLHIYIQIFAYVVYVAAASMGIWLALQSQQYFDIWSDPHPIIGIVILAFGTLQPATGWIHHRIYRSRAVAIATTSRGPRPGRTAWGYFHLWIGRILITLGIINGGLGLRLMETSPIQDLGLTHNAEIGYGIAAGFMWCLYVFMTMFWEGTRSRTRRMGVPQVSGSDNSLKPEPKILG